MRSWFRANDDIVDDEDLNELAMLDERNFRRWFRLIQLAKAELDGGRIRMANGKPATARSLSLFHERQLADAESWQQMLDRAVEIGLLALEGDTYRIVGWRSICVYDSQTKEATRERQARLRAKTQESVTTRHDRHESSREQAICHDSSQHVTTLENCHESSRVSQLVTSVTTRHDMSQVSQPVTGVTTSHNCHDIDKIRSDKDKDHLSSKIDSLSYIEADLSNAHSKNAETDRLISFCAKVFREFEPTALFGQAQKRKVSDLVERLKLKPAWKQHFAKQIDFERAFALARDETNRKRTTSGCDSPWAYFLATASQRVSGIVESRVTRENIGG